MPFDLPRNQVLPVDAVDVRLDPGPHPFETANLAAIEENWLRETDANPALFDGQVVLLSRLSYAAGRLSGRCHAIRYATFLHWRRHRETARAEHAFAHAALVTGDDALLAVRMAGWTANAGRVYFAAGSFEPEDFPQGRADLHANMAREVREETGLSLAEAQREPIHHFLSIPTGTVIFRRYRFVEDAETLAARVRAHVAADATPEIEGPVIIRHPADLPDDLAPHMAPMIAWHFGSSP